MTTAERLYLAVDRDGGTSLSAVLLWLGIGAFAVVGAGMGVGAAVGIGAAIRHHRARGLQ